MQLLKYDPIIHYTCGHVLIETFELRLISTMRFDEIFGAVIFIVINYFNQFKSQGKNFLVFKTLDPLPFSLIENGRILIIKGFKTSCLALVSIQDDTV